MCMRGEEGGVNLSFTSTPVQNGRTCACHQTRVVFAALRIVENREKQKQSAHPIRCNPNATHALSLSRRVTTHG